MTAIWSKALRDVWFARTRALLVVLAIALGIAGFTTVLSAYAVLTRELNVQYLATNPASATLRTDAIDDALVRAVAQDPRIAVVQPRRVVAGRIKAGPAEWRAMTLFAVPDYKDVRIGKIDPEEGLWPPGLGEIWIERDAFSVARARIGDAVTVRTVGGGDHTLRVAGRVHDVGKAQARMENAVYGYVTLATLAQIGEQPYFDRLDILAAQNRFDEAFIRKVAADAGHRIAAAGHTVTRIDVPTPGKHPHAAVMGLLLLAMAVFGLFVLALSGVLVVNLMTALMASEIRQIGVMKAIGAAPGQVARIYLSQAGLLGAAALVIALAAGNLGSRALCRSLSVFLNFDIASFAVPAWVDLLAALVGLALPLLAAAYPVVKGSRVTVAAALADFGVRASEFGESRMDRFFSRLSGPTRPLLFAMRNAFRRRTRLALTVATLAVAGLFFSAAWNVRASLIHTLDRLFASRKFDLMVSLGGMLSAEKVERACRKTPGVLAQEGWIATEGSVPADSNSSAPGPAHASAGSGAAMHGGGALGPDRFSVLALPESTRMLTPDIVDGRGLRPGDIDAIVVNSALAARVPQMKVGREISIAMGPGTTSWRVVGIVREPFSPPAAYVTRALFDRHGHAGMVNTLRLSLKKSDEASIGTVRAQLETNLAAEGVTVLGSASKAESRYAFDQHMVMIYVLLVVASAVIGGVGGLGLATTMSLAVLERRREIGILRAVGAKPSAVAWLVLAESAAIGIASWMVAAVAAWPVGKATADFLVAGLFRDRLDFSFEGVSLLIWLAVSLSIAAAASILPAWTASRRPVREALEYE